MVLRRTRITMEFGVIGAPGSPSPRFIVYLVGKCQGKNGVKRGEKSENPVVKVLK